jgi:hypothetical protein
MSENYCKKWMTDTAYRIVVLVVDGWVRDADGMWSKMGKPHYKIKDGEVVETSVWTLDEAWQDCRSG